MSKIDYQDLSAKIMDNIGGVKNVKTVTHCVTRLRFYLHDRNIAEDSEIKKLPGVLGVVYGNGQYQIILGEHLFNVYDNIVKNYSVETEDAIDENLDEDLVQSSEKKNFKYYFSKVILFMGQAMTPFITVVYGAGMLRVVLSLVSYFAPAAAESSTYQLFDFMSQAPFYADSGSLWNIKSIESKPRFFNRYGSGAFIPEFYRYDGSRRSSDNDETSGLFNDIRKYVASGNFLGNTGSLS